ncbi:MAG: glycerol kinase GlpK [Leucobacter sp.]
MAKYILAIDQGTTSTRAIVFDKAGHIVATGQQEHTQHMKRAGWVEHDAAEIWRHTQEVLGTALGRAKLNESDIAAIGITNQRETTVVWDRETGEPVAPAIVWQDTRTQEIVDTLAAGSDLGVDRFKDLTGLPLASYFSASKIAWILEHVDGARAKADAGKLAFGTTDSWVLWNLTGGVNNGVHATDVTNASRTMLMDLKTLEWHDELLEAFGVPRSMLPEIRSSSEEFGIAGEASLLRGTPIAGILGDQQAATFGQAAFEAGDSKNTYGTGCFLMFQTGEEIVHSKNGLITTVGYKLGDGPTHYALEGSIAVAGSLIQWLRDQLGLIKSAPEVEQLASSVDDNGGVYLVPAFSGLFAPYWRPDARGAIVGLTRYSNRGHIARAALEAVAYQTRDVLDAVNADVRALHGASLTELRVDGGMVANDALLQFQADMLGVPVVRPAVTETTALGAAYAAGLAVGFWSGLDELRENWKEDQRWEPQMDEAERERLLRQWRKAVTKSMDWVDDDVS